MRYRLHPWLLLLALLTVCVTIVGVVVLLRYQASSTTSGVVRYLPTGDAFVLYIDFDALRKAGLRDLLDSSKVPEEPEYKTFVAQSGFDYRQDLDSALVSFRPDGVFMFVRGKFNWRTLQGYVHLQGGTCNNGFCRVAGSSPERQISFFPMRTSLMALAVSKDDWAATQLRAQHRNTPPITVPNQPVWLLVPPGRLKSFDSLPSGTRQFARAIEGAEKILLSIGPRDDHYEAVLDVTSHSAADASLLLTHLQGITTFLQKMIADQHRPPNAGDLSGVLTAGVFERQDRRVLGRWPLGRAFLQALASGSL